MKKYFFLISIVFLSISLKAQRQLIKLWETDSVVNMPESVLHDPKAKLLYVSIMGNSPDDKDGIGGIGKLGLDGKVINLEWITGLNSPKGLAKFGNLLYAADLTEVVVMDIAKGKVIRKIPIENTKFLNDVTVDDKGVVYVSDSRTKEIFKIENNVPSLYLSNLSGVNGLKALKKDLYILAGKKFLKADENKKITEIAELPAGGDGLEPIGNGDFICSSWGGYVYYVTADGQTEVLLDTHLEKKNTADIGYDPVKKIVYIPTFYKKTVMAYQLK
ncbi:ATP-binding protein [Pedobacter gandavensis]|uniref:ATP-binding protein n=1 Tax=Pedobacter TaxID=84567 RepID=UPI001C99E2EC|nr:MULTISPECIES: ATP-binding protein [Pedobacter]WGQ08223.1 ATP-binding protein [Pedobacter gandavensis]